jgi:hypothetical protein
MTQSFWNATHTPQDSSDRIEPPVEEKRAGTPDEKQRIKDCGQQEVLPPCM